MKYISYIGSKMKLKDFLEETIISKFDKNDKEILFIDAFAGTTFVSNTVYQQTKWNILIFDLSPFVKILSSIINPNIDKEKIITIAKKLNKIDGKKGIVFHELSINGNVKTITDKEKTFNNQECNSRMFFSEENGKKIDAIRNEIFLLHKENKITEEEKNILLLMLVNFIDRNANTTSVYGAYLKKDKTKTNPFINENLIQDIIHKNHDKERKVCVKIGDIIDNLKSIKNNNKKKTIIYLDPPYNTRRYETNYHILNYIIDENFSIKDIKFNSKTATPSNIQNNDFASKKKTFDIFEKMIVESLKLSENIFISYNNEGTINQEFMEKLSQKHNFKLITHMKDYKRFTSGEKTLDIKNKKKEVKEIIWEIH